MLTIWWIGVLILFFMSIYYGFSLALGLIGYNAKRKYWSFNTLIANWGLLFIFTLILHVVFGI
jgi:hypothetical protein